jgi:protein gp37
MTHRQGAMADAAEKKGRNAGRSADYRGLTVLNGRGDRHFNGVVRCLEDRLADPLKWRTPRRVFVNSMGDLFHPSVPFEYIDRVYAVMALCPQHTFQILTKRPERMAEYLLRSREGVHPWELPAHPITEFAVAKQVVELCCENDLDADRMDQAVSGDWPRNWPLPNVWHGTSVEDQPAADERIGHLLRCPSAVRFLSCEPLIGGVDLPIPVGCRACNHPGPQLLAREGCHRCGGTGHEPSIDWVIVGGESGHGARPCDLGWIRWIVEQCAEAGVPVFVKQLGARPCDASLGVPVVPDEHIHNAEQGHIAGNGVQIELADAKGGDPAEWPADLRVREMPRAGGLA